MSLPPDQAVVVNIGLKLRDVVEALNEVGTGGNQRVFLAYERHDGSRDYEPIVKVVRDRVGDLLIFTESELGE